MDYEQRLKDLEDEVQHEREMRLIHATHLSAPDSSSAYIREMLADTVKFVKDAAVNLAKLELEVSNLVRAITKDHSTTARSRRPPNNKFPVLAGKEGAHTKRFPGGWVHAH